MSQDISFREALAYAIHPDTRLSHIADSDFEQVTEAAREYEKVLRQAESAAREEPFDDRAVKINDLAREWDRFRQATGLWPSDGD